MWADDVAKRFRGDLAPLPLINSAHDIILMVLFCTIRLLASFLYIILVVNYSKDCVYTV